jgi:hypothetical protein
MKRLALVLGFTLVTTLGQAQIKVGSSNTVGVGAVPTAARKLDVEFNFNGEYSAGLVSTYTGLTSISAGNPVAVTGRAAPRVGWGYGAHFMGGSIGVEAVVPAWPGTNLTMPIGGEWYDDYIYGLSAKAFGGNPTANSYRIDYATGVYAEANGAALATYGIYAKASNAGVAGQNYAGFFNGNVVITGTLNPSDGRLKQDIASLDGADVLRQLGRLTPRSYTYLRGGTAARLSLPEGRQYGLVAQEIEAVFPELVRDVTVPVSPAAPGEARAEGGLSTIKTINYNGLIPLLLRAVQEQQTQIDEQRVEIERLRARLDGLGIK